MAKKVKEEVIPEEVVIPKTDSIPVPVVNYDGPQESAINITAK